MDLYADTILEHYRHPHAKRPLPDATVEHEEVNLSCGDAVTVRMKIENGVVTDLGWDGTGCAISQAGMSMLAEDLAGKTTDELERLSQKDILTLLGVPIGPRRLKCALLCLHTLKNTLRKAKAEAPKGWLDTVEIDD